MELAQRHLPAAPSATRKMESSDEQFQFELTCRVPRCLLQQAPTGPAAPLSPRHVQWQEAGFERTRPLIFCVPDRKSSAAWCPIIPGERKPGEMREHLRNVACYRLWSGVILKETGLLNRVFRFFLLIRRFRGFGLGRFFSSLVFRLRQFHPPHRGRYQFALLFGVLNSHAVADR